MTTPIQHPLQPGTIIRHNIQDSKQTYLAIVLKTEEVNGGWDYTCWSSLNPRLNPTEDPVDLDCDEFTIYDTEVVAIIELP